MSKFTVTVFNQTGRQQNYALFNELPTVSNAPGNMFSHAFSIARTPPDQNSEFEVWPQHYAIVGASQGAIANGAHVDIAGARPVVLGKQNNDGSVTPGTSVGIKVDEGAPQFDSAQLENRGQVGAFEIRTGSDFSTSDAKQGHFIIGVGASKNGNSHDGPASTFSALPGMSYQIIPNSTYYLTFGQYKEGSVIDVSTVGPSAKIPFSTDTPDYTVTHNDRGELVVKPGSPNDDQ